MSDAKSEVETPKEETPQKPKITSHVKEKDPKRVEAGRRLGAISKAAKEKKAQERLKAQSRKHSVEITEDEEVISKSEEMDHTMLYLTIAGVIIGAIGLYFTWKSEHKKHHKKKDESKSRKNRSSSPEPQPATDDYFSAQPQHNPYLRSF